MICDVSKHKGLIDWDLLAPHLDFVIIKASGLYVNGSDPYYARNVQGAVSHNVPYHAFHFLYCLTVEDAKRDAALFFRTVAAQGSWPLFWVLDCEGAWGVSFSRARPVAEAFEAELRRLAREGGAGEIKVALYIGHGYYLSYALDYEHYAYIWIPRYGSNNGTIEASIYPDFECDMWQFTSKGRVPGINGDVDLSILTGSKPLSFFTGKTDEKEIGGVDTMATVYVGGASIDENGKAHGGKAGNQTGKELKKQKYYVHSKGWRVFRAKSADIAEKIAACMDAAIANRHIGYDQYERNTLYKAAQPFGFDVSKVVKDVECDCSALVRVCCAFAGIMGLPEGFRTTNEPKNLLATGAFVELTGSKYTGQALYLGRGDILCTATQGHTVVVLSNGSKYEGSVEAKDYGLGDRIIKHGCDGADVKIMQELLLKLGYDLGKWGADGDFGDATELALIAFQRDAGIVADGECGPITIAALGKALDALDDKQPADVDETVRIEGGDCYIRSAPNTSGKKLGVAHKGDTFKYAGETSDAGWLLVKYNGANGWVSGKYGKLVA